VLSVALVAVCLGYFMVILDTTIVNVALPALREDLGATVSGLQWVVDGYLLMFAALLLSGGVLADRIGARQVFQLGLGLFVLASVGCGLAPTTVVLVIARLVQGVGAALAVPASLALLRAAYPETAARARAIGMWGGIAGVAAAAGPILGGVLVTTASWRLVFFVNIPIGLLALVLIARRVPAPDPRPRGLDPAAQVTGVLALAALTLALIEGGHVIAGAHTPYPLLIAPLVAAGFGMSFTMPAATTAVMEGAPAERAGLASGAINASRQVGGVIGVALLGAVVSGSATFIPGLHIAVIIAGAAFLSGAVLTFVTVRRAQPAIRGDVGGGVWWFGRSLR